MTSGGGYYCNYCGAWVPLGNYHACQQYTPAPPQPTWTWTTTTDYSAVLERIAAALERIAEKLHG